MSDRRDGNDDELDARVHAIFAVLREQVVVVVERFWERFRRRLEQEPEPVRGQGSLVTMTGGFLVDFVNFGVRVVVPPERRPDPEREEED